MDTLTPMSRRYPGPPSSVGGGEYQDRHSHPPPPPMQQPQPGQFWYAPPPPSAPSGELQLYPPHHYPQQQQQYPVPPMASGPFHPLHPPQYPQHQPPPPPPWAPPPDHLQQSYQYQPSNFPPPGPPPSGMHPGGPSPVATSSPHRHGVSPPNPPYPGARPVYHPPAHPSHPPPPLPPVPSATLPHAYSQPIQAWENPTWHSTQGWEYSDSKFHYNNEEDWAARARAWAAANSATESLPMQPHYLPSETQNNVYHDQYHLGPGLPFTESQPSSLSTQDQPFADSVNDLHRRINSSQESSLNSMSYSVTNFSTYDARNEGLPTDTSVTPSPPQRQFSSSTSINVQEVPSSYSSVSGNKEVVDQSEMSSVLPHLSSPAISVPGQLPSSALNSVSREQLHLPYIDQSVEFPCAGERPQTIEQASFDRCQTQNTGSSNADQGRTIDQGLPLSSIHGWAQPVPPGPLFPHVTPVPPGPQFDSSSIPSSLPGRPAQVFGRIQGPNFQQGIPPVNAPFAFDAGSSLHPAAVFPLDANEAFNLSERPKKAAVPNWLRDEIIKKKATITSSTPEHPNGDSTSTVMEISEKASRKVDLADSKSMDSTRSTEDEDDDEEDRDAARTAAINQEIKRVLTDVLLKVTDELFEEIATKVLNEDDLEVDHTTVVAKRKESLSPPQSTTPKSSAKIVVPAATTGGKSGAVGHSLLDSGGLLGLANYASDDDSEETLASNVPCTENANDSSNHRETHDATLDHSLKHEKLSPKVTVEKPGDGPIDARNDKGNSASSIGLHKNLLEMGKSETAVRSSESGTAFDQRVIREKTDLESESVHGDHGKGKSKPSQLTESLGKSCSGDVPHDRKYSSVRNSTNELESVGAKGNREGVGSGNLKKQMNRDQKPEKTDEQGTSRRSKDQSSKQSSDVRESESIRAMYHDNDVNGKNGSGREKKDRMKEDDHWKRERTREEKEDRFREVRDAHRPKNRLASSPNPRGRSGKDTSFGSPSDESGEEISETSKRRRLQSSRHSLSPSPTRPRRQDLRSPHSKHTQRRHSPYSHSDTRRRRRSRSTSPAHRKRSGRER